MKVGVGVELGDGVGVGLLATVLVTAGVGVSVALGAARAVACARGVGLVPQEARSIAKKSNSDPVMARNPGKCLASGMAKGPQRGLVRIA